MQRHGPKVNQPIRLHFTHMQGTSVFRAAAKVWRAWTLSSDPPTVLDPMQEGKRTSPLSQLDGFLPSSKFSPSVLTRDLTANIKWGQRDISTLENFVI